MNIRIIISSNGNYSIPILTDIFHIYKMLSFQRPPEQQLAFCEQVSATLILNQLKGKRGQIAATLRGEPDDIPSYAQEGTSDHYDTTISVTPDNPWDSQQDETWLHHLQFTRNTSPNVPSAPDGQSVSLSSRTEGPDS